jgi:hypothetical protein
MAFASWEESGGGDGVAAEVDVRPALRAFYEWLEESGFGPPDPSFALLSL